MQDPETLRRLNEELVSLHAKNAMLRVKVKRYQHILDEIARLAKVEHVHGPLLPALKQRLFPFAEEPA